jgi:hypothetical protein
VPGPPQIAGVDGSGFGSSPTVKPGPISSAVTRRGRSPSAASAIGSPEEAVLAPAPPLAPAGLGLSVGAVVTGVLATGAAGATVIADGAAAGAAVTVPAAAAAGRGGEQGGGVTTNPTVREEVMGEESRHRGTAGRGGQHHP